MAGMEPELQALVEAHAPYLRVLDDGKIQCTLNGHAFAPRKDVIEAFVSGKKYQKLKRRKEAVDESTKYGPFLEPSINFPAMLFCSLTNQLIDKRKERIELHVNGKRFQTAKARYEAGDLELWAEPTQEELDAMEAELLAEGEDIEEEVEEEEGDDIIDDDVALLEEEEEEGSEEDDEDLEEDDDVETAALVAAAAAAAPIEDDEMEVEEDEFLEEEEESDLEVDLEGIDEDDEEDVDDDGIDEPVLKKARAAAPEESQDTDCSGSESEEHEEEPEKEVPAAANGKAAKKPAAAKKVAKKKPPRPAKKAKAKGKATPLKKIADKKIAKAAGGASGSKAKKQQARRSSGILEYIQGISPWKTSGAPKKRTSPRHQKDQPSLRDSCNIM